MPAPVGAINRLVPRSAEKNSFTAKYRRSSVDIYEWKVAAEHLSSQITTFADESSEKRRPYTY